MAKAIYIPVTVAATKIAWLDYLTAPPNTSYAVEAGSGATGSFTVSYTLDDPNEANPNAPNYGWTPIWIPDPVNGTAQTASVAGFYQFPVTGLRFVFSAVGGAAVGWMIAVLQGMSAR